MVKNLPSVIDTYKKQLERIADLKEVGEDVPKVETEMFEAINNAIACMQTYLDTQKLNDRKFETGCYLNHNLEFVHIKRVTETSAWIDGLEKSNRFNILHGRYGQDIRGWFSVTP